MPIDDDLRELATGPNFAALTTLFPDGQPQTHIVWVDADDDALLVNTEVHRPKYTNVMADPRVTVTVWDHTDPYHFIEARGRVVGTIGGQEARDHIDACSRRYLGKDYDNPITSERVVLRIVPDRIVRFGH